MYLHAVCEYEKVICIPFITHPAHADEKFSSPRFLWVESHETFTAFSCASFTLDMHLFFAESFIHSNFRRNYYAMLLKKIRAYFYYIVRLIR